MDITDECCELILILLYEVELAGKWLTNVSTTLFILTHKSVTSERPMALLPTLQKGGGS